MLEPLTFSATRVSTGKNLPILDDNEKAELSALSDVMKTWVEDIRVWDGVCFPRMVSLAAIAPNQE